jgi:Flp pilus assembly pilin Flp
MSKFFARLWHNQDGVLSFEWTLLLTLVVIGIVAGLAGARDAVIAELGDVAGATVALNQSYSMPGLPELGIPDSQFEDEPSDVGVERSLPGGMSPQNDADDGA